MLSQRRFAQRKLLKHCCAAICYETGAHLVKVNVFTLLTELLDTFLSEVALESKRYAELAGRSAPIPADVLTALIDMGMEMQPLMDYCQQPRRVFLPAPPVDNTPDFVVDQAFAPELPKQRPGYVPDHMPQFPPPHTYIKNATEPTPNLSYMLVRERLASQRRSVERALVKLLAASKMRALENASDTHQESTIDMPSLFKTDLHAFPGIIPLL